MSEKPKLGVTSPDDGVDIMQVNIDKRLSWNKKVEAYLKECTKRNIPFCSSCANQAQEKWKVEQQRQAVALVSRGKPRPVIGEFTTDLKQFTKTLDFVGETMKYDKHKYREPVPVIFKDYRCSVCEGGFSLQVVEEAKKL